VHAIEYRGIVTLPVVAIVGRPNVGKSTLFNRLVGFRKAVVHDRPGVTRDRLYEEGEIQGRNVLIIDTGGLEPDPETDLLSSMRTQSLVAVEEADVIVLVVDARAGMTPSDEDVADILRQASKPVVVAVNKVDGPRFEDLAADFWSMGLPVMVTTSAEHGRGMYELGEAIAEHLPEQEPAELDPPEDLNEDDLTGEEAADDAFEGPIRIAVIGRPNIGKSTLVNRLLGEERQIVNDSPGTTMDPVDTALTVGDREYVLVDTAGVRKRAKIGDKLERFVTLRAIRSIERCHVSLLMIDATLGPTDQDAKLAQLVAIRGRALVVLINKWDLTADLEDVNSYSTEDELERRLPHAAWAPHLFISAKTGKGLHRILPTVEEAFEKFNTRISTPRLNRWMERVVQAHTPPQRHHRPVRLLYMAQTRVRPPSFVFISNTPDGITKAYRSYLTNRLREDFGFDGTPIRAHFRRRKQKGEPDA
jgi:GTPase